MIKKNSYSFDFLPPGLTFTSNFALIDAESVVQGHFASNDINSDLVIEEKFENMNNIIMVLA